MFTEGHGASLGTFMGGVNLTIHDTNGGAGQDLRCLLGLLDAVLEVPETGDTLPRAGPLVSVPRARWLSRIGI